MTTTVTHDEALRRVRGMVVSRAESDEPRLREYIEQQRSAAASTQALREAAERVLRLGEALDTLTSTSVEMPSCVAETGEYCGAPVDDSVYDTADECPHDMVAGATICADCGSEGTCSPSAHTECCRKVLAIHTVLEALDALRSALAAETSGRDGGGNG